MSRKTRCRIEMNITDMDDAIMMFLRQKFPDLDVTGYVVRSFNKIVLDTEDGMLQEPVRHKLDPDKSEFRLIP